MPYFGEYATSFVEGRCLKVGDHFDAVRYLFPYGRRSYLLGKDRRGDITEVGPGQLSSGIRYLVICFFTIPVVADDVKSTCNDFVDIIHELDRQKHDDFRVVLVTRISSKYPKPDSVFRRFFKAFSSRFFAVPLLDNKQSHHLFQLVGTSSHDTADCVVADLLKQEVSHTGFYHFELHGADFYPFTPEKLQELTEQVVSMRCGKIPLSTFLRHQSSDVLQCEAHFSEFTSSCGKKESLSGLANNIVWLYFLCDGSFMDQLRDLYNKCKDNQEKFDFEIVVVRSKEYLVSGEKRVRVDSLLKHPDCCGWLHLPFDDRVSRRVYNLCDYSCYDKLVVVGPNTSYADQGGREVFQEFGIDAYPFTKQTAWDNEVKRLRNVKLAHWLNSCEIHSLVTSNDEIFPVTKLEGTNVLVIFCTTMPFNSKLCLDWYGGNVLEWVKEMKTASKRRFEVIFLSTSQLSEDGLQEMNELCANNGWLRPDPFDCDRNTTLHHLLFGRLLLSHMGLVAFGPDGNLLRLCLQYSLQWDLGPARFPNSDEDGLATDVGVHLNSRSDDTWCGVFDVSGWRGDLM